jgi:hypothetical protein
VGGLHAPLIIVPNQGVVLEELESGAIVDLGLVLHDGDDIEGRAVFEFDSLNSIGIPAFLVEGDETLGDVFDILRFDILEDIDGDEIAEELGEKAVVPQDELDRIVLDITYSSHSGLLVISGGHRVKRFKEGEKICEKERKLAETAHGGGLHYPPGRPGVSHRI